MDFANELNAEQLAAVEHIQGPLRILACAGSGKTRTLIYRVAYMLEHGIAPEHILLLTFTNKAADEMKARAAALGTEGAELITACTFHSFCNILLRQYGDRLPIGKSFTILNASQMIDAVGMVRSDCGYANSKKYPNFPSDKVIAGIFSLSVNTEQSIEDVCAMHDDPYVLQYIDELTSMYASYEAYTAAKHYVDFDQLLAWGRNLLRDDDDMHRILNNWYSYAMVDEYQDTNRLQEDFLLRLTDIHRNLCVVGDDYQSIYAFRGAEVKNIMNLPNKIPGMETITLHQNYRSDQRILTLCNDVMKKHAHEGIYKEMRSTISDGQMPRRVYVENDYTDQGDAVAAIVKDCLNRGYKHSDIAVLTKETSQVGKSYEKYLLESHEDYNMFGGLKFMERNCIQNVIGLFGLLLNPHDSLSYYRIAKMFSGVGEAYAHKIAVTAEQLGYDGLIDPKFYRCQRFFDSLKELHDKLLEWGRVPYPDLLDEVENWYIQTYDRELRKRDCKNRDELLKENRKSREYFDILNMMSDGHRTLSAFMDALKLDGAEKKFDPALITLSTIHSAKGLEWPVVIIVSCADNAFPRDTVMPSSSEDEETLRCFYVAMTRAKRELYLICPVASKPRDSSGMPYPLYPMRYLQGVSDDMESYSWNYRNLVRINDTK